MTRTGRARAFPANLGPIAPTPPAPAAPGVLREEVVVVLMLSLLASAVYSILSLLEAPLEGTVVASANQSTQLARQLVGFVFGLAPVFLVMHLVRRSGEGLAGIGLSTDRPAFRSREGPRVVRRGRFRRGSALYLGAVELGVNRFVIPAPPLGHWWTVPVLVLTALEAALVEEVIVLGYLMTRLRQLTWSPLAAVVASASLRASYHLYQGWGGFLGNLAMGLLFAVLFLRWRRTWPFVVAHFLLDVAAGLGLHRLPRTTARLLRPRDDDPAWLRGFRFRPRAGYDSAPRRNGGMRRPTTEHGRPMSSVLDYLRGRGVPFVVFPDPEADVAEQTAERHGVDVDELVRTEVVSNRFGFALMVVPWDRRLDLTLARRAMNDPDARLATREELVAKVPEFDPDSWPPLGLFLLMPTFVDREVAGRDQVVFPAGKPGTLVCLQTDELFGDDPVVITVLTNETMKREPVGTRRGNLWAVRADPEHPAIG